MSINLSVKELSLDLQSQGYTNTIVLPQGDSNSRKLIISLYDGGKKYAIPKSDYITVDLVGSRADGAVVNRHVDEYSDNIITLIFRDEELAVKGTAKYKINIVSYNDNKHIVLSSFPFKIKVLENVYDSNGLIAYPKIDTIDEMIIKAGEIARDEQVRITNENIRITNEQNRLQAETTRINSETQRTNAETARVNAESVREASEIARVNAENNRILAENNREINETARETAENARVHAEQNRENAEDTRIQSETNRETAEAQRVQAEIIRANAENTRQTNEQARITAEQARESAETNRENEWNELKEEATEEIAKASTINISATKESNSFSVSITDKDGNVTDSGNLMGEISIGVINTVGSDEQATASLTGAYGEQKLNLNLPVGKPYRLVKSYSSIADMIIDYDSSTDVALYEFVIIDTGDVEDPDNAKMYMKGEDAWIFIADLSGSAGVQGLTGKTPVFSIGTVSTGAENSDATVTITGTTDNPVLNFTIPRGAAGTVSNLSALTLPYSGTDDTDTTKDVVDALKTEVADKLDASALSQMLVDGDYLKILSYTELSDTTSGKFIFKDTEENTNLALDEEKLPEGTIVIITG